MASAMYVNRRLMDDIRDEPKQMLIPIAGYERQPLVSLEEACKPLQGILDHQLKQNIFIAKKNSEQPKNGLTQDESASIHLYTMEWNASKQSLYSVLNQALRSADRAKLVPWFRYLKLLMTAIFKLP